MPGAASQLPMPEMDPPIPAKVSPTLRPQRFSLSSRSSAPSEECFSSDTTDPKDGGHKRGGGGVSENESPKDVSAKSTSHQGVLRRCLLHRDTVGHQRAPRLLALLVRCASPVWLQSAACSAGAVRLTGSTPIG
ncbi:MAG: hypothetical protein WDW36_009154 [Sanguina aurantia]